MNKSQIIMVRTEIDIITARMYVRDMARALGMNLGDQARISLATSSLAHALGIGVSRQGQITIETVYNGDRKGLRVTCTEKNGVQDLTQLALGDTRWMVDECTIEKLPSNTMQVTLTKWVA